LPGILAQWARGKLRPRERQGGHDVSAGAWPDYGGVVRAPVRHGMLRVPLPGSATMAARCRRHRDGQPFLLDTRCRRHGDGHAHRGDEPATPMIASGMIGAHGMATMRIIIVLASDSLARLPLGIYRRRLLKSLSRHGVRQRGSQRRIDRAARINPRPAPCRAVRCQPAQ